MKTIHYMGLGVLAGVGLLLAWPSKASPAPLPPGPTPRPDINPGKLADIGDIVTVPMQSVSTVPYFSPVMPLRGGEYVDKFRIRVDVIAPMPPYGEGLQGEVVGYSYRGPSSSGGGTVPEGMRSTTFMRRDVLETERGGVRIA